MKFRPCIDLHNGRVKQIVGGSLRDGDPGALQTNFDSDRPAAFFADRYRRDGLPGGHVIQLGPDNAKAARAALRAYPEGLQVGGGITADNAAAWLDEGASHVIVTSFVFRDGQIDRDRLGRLVQAVGKERLVLDLSCRRRGDRFYVVTDRWQRFTDVPLTPETLDDLALHAAEFLVHAADVEGRCSGIEEPVVKILGAWSGLPVTYAGGIRSMDDVERIGELGEGSVDFTVGSALDLFGGSGIRYADLLAFRD